MSTQCGNCGREIGRLEHGGTWDGHTVCAKCRRLLADNAEADALRGSGSVVIEQTAKRWKLLTLLGFLIALPGGAIAVRAFDVHDAQNLTLGGMMIAIGAGLVAVGQFFAWWNHG